jgi:mRNA-degrading endonuclease RelE of RelBE toxin-antitoxin system
LPYDIVYMPIALEHLRSLTARQQRTVLDGVERHLRHQPDVPTRNRKRMRPNKLATWELRIGELRAFYEIEEEIEAETDNAKIASSPTVVILAVGIKRGNRLWIADEEYEL